jgi:hypothetical protein
MIGHGAGYRGIVADQAGHRLIEAIEKSGSTVRGLNGATDSSATGALSTGLTIVGFVPGLGQLASGASLVVDAVKTGMAIAQCP